MVQQGFNSRFVESTKKKLSLMMGRIAQQRRFRDVLEFKGDDTFLQIPELIPF